MITKAETITRYYTLIEKKDIVKAFERLTGTRFKISDMSLHIYDHSPLHGTSAKPYDYGVTFTIEVCDQFGPYPNDILFEGLDIPSVWEGVGRPTNTIFNFDVKEFKKYTRTTEAY